MVLVVPHDAVAVLMGELVRDRDLARVREDDRRILHAAERRKPVRTTSISGYGNVPNAAEYVSSDRTEYPSAVFALARDVPRPVRHDDLRLARLAAHGREMPCGPFEVTDVVGLVRRTRRWPSVCDETATPVVGVSQPIGTLSVTW